MVVGVGGGAAAAGDAAGVGVTATNAKQATEPEFDPVTPEDLATTMYHLLGIVADKELMAPGDRPIEICDGGNLIKGILA